MHALTRRRVQGVHQQCWHVFFGDVHVRTIAQRAGVPHDVDQWGWACGFYPVTHPLTHADGTAETFEQARADFEAAWAEYLPRCTPADFEEYRRQRALTEWKHAMDDTGTKMPTALPNGRWRYFCGATINIASTSQHVYDAHMTAESSL
jgi:hypothetical protein